MEHQLTKHDLALESLEDDALDVLDLPQIHTRPSAKALLDTLQLLSVESRSWEVTPPRTPGRNTPTAGSGTSTPHNLRKRRVKAAGLPAYLTKIVSSPLGWITNESEKEQIYDLASVRLSERSGRTAMGAFTRTFAVPMQTARVVDSHTDVSSAKTDEEPVDGVENHDIDIAIHEPALTGDDLGLKTWAASYVLARMWSALFHQVPVLARCLPRLNGRETVLELGAGTGLVGIAAAAVLGAKVLLTDLPAIAANLARNVDANTTAITANGGEASVAVLDWSQPKLRKSFTTDGEHQVFDAAVDDGRAEALVVVAADPIYSEEHPALLTQAIQYHLSDDTSATLIIAVPVRKAYAQERAQLRQRLMDLQLRLVFESVEIGFDDWTTKGDDEPIEVECNVSVWQRLASEAA